MWDVVVWMDLMQIAVRPLYYLPGGIMPEIGLVAQECWREPRMRPKIVMSIIERAKNIETPWSRRILKPAKRVDYHASSR